MCAAHFGAPPQASVGPESPKKINGPSFSDHHHHTLAAIENGFLLCGVLDIEAMHPSLGALAGWPSALVLASVLETLSIINLKLTVDTETTIIGRHSSGVLVL